MTLHFSHIFLTDGRTFMTLRLLRPLLVAVGDATTAEVVGRELHLHPVAGQDPDVVHPHLPGDVREHLVAVLQLDSEHRVRQRLDDRPLDEDRVVLGLRQGAPPATTGRAKYAPGTTGPTEQDTRRSLGTEIWRVTRVAETRRAA